MYRTAAVSGRIVPNEQAVFDERMTAGMVVNRAAAPASPVFHKLTAQDHWRTSVVVYGPSCVAGGSGGVLSKPTVSNDRVASDVKNGSSIMCLVLGEYAACDRGVSFDIEKTGAAAGDIRIVSVLNGKAVQDRRYIGAAAGDNMVAVVGADTTGSKVAFQNRYVSFGGARGPIAATVGKAAINGDFTHELIGGISVIS